MNDKKTEAREVEMSLSGNLEVLREFCLGTPFENNLEALVNYVHGLEEYVSRIQRDLSILGQAEAIKQHLAQQVIELRQRNQNIQ
jgi:hypothetical protein